ncbi:SDR family oxidoreductase [Chitinophaga pollutisoli]|uniref:SDR family oxidoreductase n=1 Tax=Chitinophaga pollutisoli TaxID=3133966 RepID=A0ABZ2YTX7_9BACT
MKVMIITGASRGIGAATALLAARAGYAVAVNYHQNKPAAEAVVAEIVRNGGTAKAIQANVAVEPGVLALFEACDKHFGIPDALVNNAGILEQQMRVEELTEDRLRRIFASNITGPFLCAREAVKRMSLKYGGRGGTIVNVSSVAAKTGSPGEYTDYAASKGAIDTLTVGLAKEVAEEGIRVNAVRPGFIYTDIHADGGEPGRVDRVKASVPLKRGGLPAEVAEAILWLASDKSAFTTGGFIDVSGGR